MSARECIGVASAIAVAIAPLAALWMVAFATGAGW